MAKGKKDDGLEAAKATLSKWQTLDGFGKSLKDAEDTFDSKSFFNLSGLTFLREAWVGLRLARALNALAMRLDGGDWPDVWIRVQDTERGFEVVEVMEEGRKRGDEAWDGTVKHCSDEYLSKRAEQIPSQLRKVVHKKCMKGYPATAALLVYLNDWYETEASLHEATGEARHKFTQVWILWQDRCYLVWDAGVRSTTVLGIG
jgi:hypothetical protein